MQNFTVLQMGIGLWNGCSKEMKTCDALTKIEMQHFSPVTPDGCNWGEEYLVSLG